MFSFCLRKVKFLKKFILVLFRKLSSLVKIKRKVFAVKFLFKNYFAKLFELKNELKTLLAPFFVYPLNILPHIRLKVTSK